MSDPYKVCREAGVKLPRTMFPSADAVREVVAGLVSAKEPDHHNIGASDMWHYDIAETIVQVVYWPFDGVYYAEEKNAREVEIEAYKYIPYNRADFVRRVLPLFGKCKRFIDVGMGIGDKVLLADLFTDMECHGVEINEFTSGVARQCLCRLYANHFGWGTNLKTNDAFNMSFEPFDAIYMYRPIVGKKIADLWRHVARTMPEDGVLIEVYPHIRPPWIDDNMFDVLGGGPNVHGYGAFRKVDGKLEAIA